MPAEAPLASEVVDFVGAKIYKTILSIAQSQDDTSAVLLPRREIDAAVCIQTAAVLRYFADVIRFRHCVVSVDGWVVKLSELTIGSSARSIVSDNVNDGEGVSRGTIGGVHVST
jgi:hypothetical protein